MRILMLGYMVDSLTVSYMYYPSAKSIDDSLEMIGKKSSAQENFITSKLSKWEDAHQHMFNMIALANELGLQERPIDDKTKIPTLDDLLSKVMTQVDAKLRVNKFLVNIVEQKEFVPIGSKRFKKKRKFKSHRSDWKSNKSTYVKPNVKVKIKQIFCYHCKKP